MKKLVLAAIAVFAFGTANAQYKSIKKTTVTADTGSTSEFKPVKGTVTTEVGVSGGLFNTDFGVIDAAAKFRYFIKDDLAIRAGLGLGSRKVETNSVPAPNGNQTTTVQRYTDRVFNIGAEKHFSGSDRLSTYVGADLLFAFQGASTKTTTNFDSASNTIDGQGLGRNAGSGFGVRVTTGADYYFTKKLYLGVEVGLSYIMGTTDEVSTTNVAANGNSTTTVNFAKGSDSETSTRTIGGLKLGFQF